MRCWLMCEGRTLLRATAETEAESCVCFGCWRVDTPGGLEDKDLEGWSRTVEAGAAVLRVMADFNVLQLKRMLINDKLFWNLEISFISPSATFFCPFLLSSGWEDPSEVDSTRGHRLQKVHLGQ